MAKNKKSVVSKKSSVKSTKSHVTVADKKIGHDHQVFVIAEIGINHNGDIEIAKKLIDLAHDSGADAVKFQKRTVGVVYTPEELAKPRENPFGPTNGHLKRGLEFGLDAYKEIDRYCKEKGIFWFASCWDEGAVDFIEQFNPPIYKIASASLTDEGLLKHTRSKGKPIILSTGMSTLEEVERAVKILGTEDLVLLHTNSTYPSKDEELNLKVIQTLRQLFPVPIGYSGHEAGVVQSIFAVMHGACVIERHITLDRASWGSDQAASLAPEGFRRLVRDVKLVSICAGDGVKRVYESEVPIIAKLRRKHFSSK